jgi:hypothetical protein
MDLCLGLGTCIVFSKGLQNFLAGREYGVAAVLQSAYLLVDLSSQEDAAPHFPQLLHHEVFASLEDYEIKLPSLPPRNEKWDPYAASRLEKLEPILIHREAIVASAMPIKAFNKLARGVGLNVTRSRAHFFKFLGFGANVRGLYPNFSECGPDTDWEPAQKAGRKVKDASITTPGFKWQPGWLPILRNSFKKRMVVGGEYKAWWLDTLIHEFKCTMIELPDGNFRIVQRENKPFPTYRQASYRMKKAIGVEAWRIAKLGDAKVHNHPLVSPRRMSSAVRYLLESVQWDAQMVDELPCDGLDQRKKGEPIWVVRAVCLASGPVGLGFSYASETKYAYLMCLLSMIMPKSLFCDWFGCDVSDEDWPAIGFPLSIRGDRGPQTASTVREVLAYVLKIAAETSPSYAPLDKANVETSHDKQTKTEGKPKKVTKYRFALDIIKSIIRKTVTTFVAADRSGRADMVQAMELSGTPLGLWNDMRKRGLYAGQQFDYREFLPYALPEVTVNVRSEGVYMNGLLYYSEDLKESGVLHKAANSGAYDCKAYMAEMVTKRIWLQTGTEEPLMELTASLGLASSREMTVYLTRKEQEKLHESLCANRRNSESNRDARLLHDRIEEEETEKRTSEFIKRITSFTGRGSARVNGRLFKGNRHARRR